MANEVQSLSDEQLVHALLQAERDMVEVRFRHSMGQLENTSVLRQHRRGIARMLTATRKREVDQGLGKNSLMGSHVASFVARVGNSEAEGGAGEGGFLSGVVDKVADTE
jgi:large subunit ribosomal protein L29